jgi:hypothetical protein
MNTQPLCLRGQIRLSLSILLGIFLLALPLQAETTERSETFAQARLKSALNTMVRDVRAAESPAAKRAVLDGFLSSADRAATLLQLTPFLPAAQREAAVSVQARFNGYANDLHGNGGRPTVQDADLNAFASYMQQDIEQADGGVYLSTGAVIIVLLIILILL